MAAGPNAPATCAVWVLGAASDLASTRISLARPGAEEQNPLQRSLGAQIAAQGAFSAVGCWGDLKLQKKGKRGLARGLRIGLLALKLGIAVRNLKER